MVEVLNAEIKERIEMINRGEVPKGYKKTKVGIIPEEWEVKRLGEVGELFRGKGIPKSRILTEGIGCITYGEIYTTYNYTFKNFKSYINEKTAQNSVPIKKNDILFAGSGETLEEIGKCIAYLGEDDAYAGGDIVVFRPYDIDGEVLGYLLNHDIVNSQKYKLGQGHSVVHIYAKDLETISIPVLQGKEQQKIAQILSTWDEAIELKEKLIEEKKEQKKGLMQKLLTGEVRLPGFDGEWEEVRLGDIGKTFSGLTGKTSKDFGEGKPFITYKNIFTNSRVDIKDVNYVKILEDENQNTIKYGDIFFTISSETPDEVGMSSVLLDTVEELYLNSFCFGFRLNDFKTLVPKYARFLFRGDVFRRDIFKLAQGSTRFNLSKAEVLKLYIKLPTTDEQKAIAQILSTADKEINLLNQELEQLKLQKKGLMQLLLTGIIRVKS